MSEYIIAHCVDSVSGVRYDERREEIVRCRDCAYYNESTVDEDGEGEPSYCHRWGYEWVRYDGFCAWGERRES